MTRPSASARVALLCAALCVAAGKPASAEEIDRVLAAVNGRVVTEGDLRVNRDLNAVLRLGKDAPGGGSRASEIERLVDLELIRQELEAFPLEAGDRAGVESRMAELTEAFAEIGGLRPLLARLGLLEEELRSYLRLQASILRFVELRFRPFASVADAEIEAYYRTNLLPKLEATGGPVPKVEEVRERIREVLLGEKVNTALERWIGDLRGGASIERFGANGGKPGEVKP